MHSISSRLLVLCLVYAIPFSGIIFYQISSGINSTIQTAQLEIIGDNYLMPLAELLETIPKYRASLDAGNIAQAQAEKGEIDAAFGRLNDAQTQSGAALQITPDGLSSRHRSDFAPEVLLKKWQDLSGNSGPSKLDWAIKNDDLIAGVRGLIGHVGDTSGLILDADLDSYYLVDAVLVRMPQTIDRCAVIARRGREILADKSVDFSEQKEFTSQMNLLDQDDISSVDSDASTSLAEDKNFYGVSPSLQSNLPPALQTYDTTNRALQEAVHQIGDGKVITPDAFTAVSNPARAASEHFWQVGLDELKTLLQIRIKYYVQQRIIDYFLLLAALAFSSVIAWWVSRNLRRELSQVSTALQVASEHLVKSSGHLASSSRSLAQGANEQASSVEESSVALEEISSMTKQNAESAVVAKTLSSETRTAAEEGGQRTREMQTAMQSIKKASEEMGQAIADIRQSSRNVSTILGTIDEIAFQTNILALNAAVEAARAGTAGMGFAVVAEEVRNLAQRSAQAAKETAALIEASAQQSDHGVQANKKVVTCITEIEGKTEGLRVSLENIIAKVHEVDDVVNSISKASQEQSLGLEEVNKGISKMSSVIQANASNAQETARSSQELTVLSVNSQINVTQLARLIGHTAAMAEVTATELSPETFHPNLDPEPVYDKKPRYVQNADGRYTMRH